MPAEILTERLLKKFTTEQVALSLLLESYYENRKHFNAYISERKLNEFIHSTNFVQFAGKIKSITDVDNIWKQNFTNRPGWRENIEMPEGFIKEIKIEKENIKNRHLNCLIKHFNSENKKVFALCSQQSVQYLASAGK